MKLSVMLKWLLLASIIGVFAVWGLSSMVMALAFRGPTLIQSLLIIAAFSLVSIPCAVTHERGRVRLMMRIGLVLAAVNVIGWCVLLWTASRWSPAFGRAMQVLWTTTIVTGFCTVLSLLYQERVGRFGARIARIISIIAASILALSLMWLAWLDSDANVSSDALERYFSAMSVLTIFSLLTALILGRLKQLIQGEEKNEGGEVVRMPFSAVCPRCERRQELMTGGAACASCGLSIKVMVP